MPAAYSEKLDRWTAAVVARPGPLFALAAIVLLVQVGPWWYPSPDSAAYFSIARSFWSPEGPTAFGSSHLFYSPTYALLLSPVFFLGERPFMAAALLHWFLSLALMAGVYRWAKPLGSWSAVAVTLLTVLHVQYGIYFRRPLSETFFTTAMVWAVIVLDHFRTTQLRSERIGYGIAGTTLLTLACLIRPNGVMLIPGFGLALLATWGRREKRQLLAAVAATLLIGGIAAGVFYAARKIDDRRAAEKSAVTYWDYFVKLQDPSKPSMFARIPDGTFIQMGDFSRLIIPGMFKSRTKSEGRLNINNFVATAMTLVVVIGWWRLLRTRGDVWTWSFPFFMALNVIWAADVGTRYTLPVLPVIWAAVCMTVQPFRPRIERWLLPFVALHAVVGISYWLVTDLPRNRELNQHWPAVEELAWVVDRDQQTVAALGLTPEATQLFRFQLDRDVKAYDPAANSKQPDWIVTLAEGSTLPPGYGVGAEAGPYRMLRRNTLNPHPVDAGQTPATPLE